MGQNALYEELIEHKTRSDILLTSILLYSNNVFFTYMTIYKNVNCISQENLYSTLLFIEVGVYLQLTTLITTDFRVIIKKVRHFVSRPFFRKLKTIENKLNFKILLTM